jgi:hypothetical protein
MDESRIKEILDKRHPSYAKNIEDWEIIRDCLEYDPSFERKYLLQYPKELGKIYSNRLKRAKYFRLNLTKLVRTTYIGYLCASPPVVSSEIPECVRNFVTGKNRTNLRIDEFSRHIAEWAIPYGKLFIVVDKPNIPVLTELDKQLNNAYPYAYVIHPQDVLDYKMTGRYFDWVIIRETYREDDSWDDSGTVCIRYRVWLKDRVMCISHDQEKDSFSIVEESANPLGVIPIVLYERGDSMSSVAKLEVGIFNLRSQLDEVHLQTTFPQLIIPHQGDIETAVSTVQAMGVHSVIPFDSLIGAPAYLTAPIQPAQELRSAIHNGVNQALNIELLDGESGAADERGRNRETSGTSRAYTFEKLNKKLATDSDTLETTINQLLKFVCLWENESWDNLPEIMVDYPSNFEVKSIPQEIENFANIVSLDIDSPTFKSEISKNFVQRVMPKMSTATMLKVHEELDSSTDGFGQRIEKDDRENSIDRQRES